MQPLRCSARAPGGGRPGCGGGGARPATLVVEVLEREQREAQLLDRLERLHPEQLLLERADEALGAAVALGCGHERRARADAEEAQLALEVVAEVLAAVVVAPRNLTALTGGGGSGGATTTVIVVVVVVVALLAAAAIVWFRSRTRSRADA